MDLLPLLHCCSRRAQFRTCQTTHHLAVPMLSVPQPTAIALRCLFGELSQQVRSVLLHFYWEPERERQWQLATDDEIPPGVFDDGD